jgi:hypothetical protein
VFNTVWNSLKFVLVKYLTVFWPIIHADIIRQENSSLISTELFFAGSWILGGRKPVVLMNLPTPLSYLLVETLCSFACTQSEPNLSLDLETLKLASWKKNSPISSLELIVSTNFRRKKSIKSKFLQTKFDIFVPITHWRVQS